MLKPITFDTSNNTDNLYYHQAMKEPDTREFKKAIIKEVNTNTKRNHWELIPREKVPKVEQVLPSEWTFKRKKDIKTKRVFKHKACLNLPGGKQEYALNFFKPLSHVINWFISRMVLVLSIINGWSSRQVDFVLTFPQANIEFDM